MHQPFYKDLVTGKYRLPWVRMHALKDYYGMVKLLDEFPNVHQNFNLVPSLELQQQRAAYKSPELAVTAFDEQDFRDLQVLSQLAWFDEYFLDEPEIAALVKKGRNFDRVDQEAIGRMELHILSEVVPAYRSAAERGAAELSR